MRNISQTGRMSFSMAAVLMALGLAVSACGSDKSDDDPPVTDAGISADGGSETADGGSAAGDAGSGDAGYTGEPCGDVPVEGVCRGTVARYCAGTSIWEHDCSKDGEICTEDEMGAICAPAESADGGMEDEDGGLIDVCQGISELGVCDRENNRALICAGGSELVTLDCTNLNATCDYDSETGHAVCADKRGCGDVGEEGVCRGSMSVYCWDDVLYYEECGETAGCGWSIEFGNYCLSDALGAGDCGGVSAAGECSAAGVLRYCDDNTLYIQDCIREGYDGCGYDAELGEYMCFTNDPAVSESCGGIDTYGECSADGSSLKYCDSDDTLVVISCGSGQCEDDGFFADCVYDWMGQACGSVDAKGVCEGNVAKYCQDDVLSGETCSEPCEYNAEGYAVCP